MATRFKFPSGKPKGFLKKHSRLASYSKPAVAFTYFVRLGIAPITQVVDCLGIEKVKRVPCPR